MMVQGLEAMPLALGSCSDIAMCGPEIDLILLVKQFAL